MVIALTIELVIALIIAAGDNAAVLEAQLEPGGYTIHVFNGNRPLGTSVPGRIAANHVSTRVKDKGA